MTNRPETPRAALRRMLAEPDVLVLPGVYDALSASLAARSGFRGAYMTGAGVSMSLIGHPDLGFTTLTEMAGQVGRITSVVDVPLVADADTGFGNPLSVQRTVVEYQRAGVAGMHIEDQAFPKRCGHLDGKTVIPTGEFVNVKVPLYSVAHPFRAGSRLRIEINTPGGDSALWDFESSDYGATDHDVAHGATMASSIVLPVLPDADGRTIPDAFDAQATRPACDSLRGQPCRLHQPMVNQTVPVPPPTTTTTAPPEPTTTTTAPPDEPDPIAVEPAPVALPVRQRPVFTG